MDAEKTLGTKQINRHLILLLTSLVNKSVKKHMEGFFNSFLFPFIFHSTDV